MGEERCSCAGVVSFVFAATKAMMRSILLSAMRTRERILLCALVLFACRKEPAGAIRLGEIASMTGTGAFFGLQTSRGAQLAVQEINAAGGIHGRLVQFILLDDQSKPEEAATAATRLISSEHVVAILGADASTRSLFVAPKAQAARVPMMTPTSTNPKVTQVGDYVFRACFIDSFQGYAMARFARQHLKLKRAAILRDVRNDYSVGLADSFIQSFTRLGGEIAAEASYSEGDVDFKAQLTRFKTVAPEGIFIPGYYGDVGLIARQVRELGFSQVALFGTDGWDSERLYEIGGEALEGSTFSTHYSTDDPSPRVQEFVAKYQKAYAGQLPDTGVPQAYDAAGMLFDAMKRAKDLSGPSLRDALAQTRNYPGVTGDITLDEKRNPIKPAIVLRLGKGGRREFVAKILPESAPGR